MNKNTTETLPQSLDSKRSIWVLCSLLILAAVQFFVGLGSLPLLGPDEPRYAEVARAMFASGNYVSPFLARELWFEKPALLYWLQAASYHIFGVGEFAARFPSALAALGTVLCVYFTLRRAISWRLIRRNQSTTSRPIASRATSLASKAASASANDRGSASAACS